MSLPRILVVPGGTSIGAVALANASIHKLVELHEERHRDPHHPAPKTIVALRAPEQVGPTTLRGSALSPEDAFPAEEYPYIAERLTDPSFFDGIDVILQTSGSSSGKPRLVGLSIEALIAAVYASDATLSGPGHWILALPAHHIAGVMVLIRSAIAQTNPQIVDTSHGFDPRSLLPAIAGATQDPHIPGYISLVPTQLASCLEAGDDVVRALASLDAVLVGGAGADPLLIDRARHAKINIHTSYGMTETCGGCVYDGFALPGTSIRAFDFQGSNRIAIAGPQLMTRYLDGESPFIEEGGQRWLISGDTGNVLASGRVEIHGRADDVITSGGLSISPAPVRAATLSAPGVTDAWIVGVPDDKWGQIVTALVIPEHYPQSEDDMRAFGQRIRDHVGFQLGRIQAPRQVILTTTLPRLALGKIDRKAARLLAESNPGNLRMWRR